MGVKVGVTNRRTLRHGDLPIVAVRPGYVRVGATTYTTTQARQIARDLPPRDSVMAAKLREQADWADGKDL